MLPDYLCRGRWNLIFTEVYKSLDIITAKATKEELASVKHHVIDFLEPHEMFTVYQYQKQALKVIEDLIRNKKLPIVVGGTNYYVESLLWKILVEDGSEDIGILPRNEHELPSEELHNKLKFIDPASAKRLHPNNKRKIIRALEVYYKQGKKLSDILKEQQTSDGGSESGGGLRYTSSIVLWLQCQQDELNYRLNKRVDSMMQKGLLEELTNFHKQYNEKRLSDDSEPNYTKGVFQSIGFKEFHSYLTMKDEVTEKSSEEELNKCIDQLKLVTRRYARTQNKWIKNRFLGRIDREVPPIYSLDATDIDNWTENVVKVAEEIITAHISGTGCPHKPLEKQQTNSVPNSQDDTYKCEVCNRIYIGKYQWTLHLKSRNHKKMKILQRKQEFSGEEQVNKKLKTD